MSGLTDLELQGGHGHGLEGDGLPVRLLRLFPHHHVEAGGVLVAEDEAGVVVVRHRVDVERSLKVHAVERRVAWRERRVLLQNHAAVSVWKTVNTLMWWDGVYLPTANPGSLFMVWTISMPCRRSSTTVWLNKTLTVTDAVSKIRPGGQIWAVSSSHPASETNKIKILLFLLKYLDPIIISYV